MSLLGRLSYLLIGLILVLATGAATIGLGWGVAGQVGTMTLFAILLIYWVAVRRGEVTPRDPEKRLRRLRGSGRQVVLHFYSDYSAGCLLRRPLDAQVENRYRGRCEFVYISAFHPEAGAMMAALKANLGDWLYFDRSGKVVGQGPRLTDEQMRRFLESAPSFK